MLRTWPTIATIALAIALLMAAGGAPASDAAFPGANGLIAFTRDAGVGLDIYVVNTDGSNPQQLTDDPLDDCCPGFAADGSRIAFFSKRDGNDEIYVMKADGSVET